MHKRPIPSSGEPLPVIGCGTYVGFDVRPDDAANERLLGVLNALFAARGSVIDSSPMYGRAEGMVGELLARRRESRAFIATKVWTRGREAGIAQMQRSMALLGTDHMDLMQVHNLVDWKVHLKTLREWKESGRIRYLGVTHYTSSAYSELETVLRSEALDFVQLNYSIADRSAEQRLLPIAAERGVAVIANLPLGSGQVLRSVQGRALPGWAQEELSCTSWAQLLLKYVVGHASVTCTIPGTGQATHMADNARAGLGVMPGEAQRARILECWRRDGKGRPS
jgi:aryl-alcohol dehydrogenase-like predicted oxidoreductase